MESKTLIRLGGGELNWPETFRALVLAFVPLLALSWLTLLHPPLALMPFGWFLAAVIVGLQQALDLYSACAIMTAALAAVALIVAFLILSLFAFVAVYGHL